MRDGLRDSNAGSRELFLKSFANWVGRKNVSGRTESLAPEIGALLCIALIFLLIQEMALHHDVVWQLWIGRQLYHGADLYTDILEVNPPIWFWIGAGLFGIAKLTGLAVHAVLIGAFAATAAASLLLLAILVREKSDYERSVLYAVIVPVLLLLGIGDFGQREHFALIVSIPYVALIARRLEGQPVHVGLAIGIACFAGLGFALKHYFALVPLALELLLATNRSTWRIWRPELVTLAMMGSLYSMAIVIIEPDFLTNMLPMITLAYGGYERSWTELLSQPLTGVATLFACGFIMLRNRPPPLAAAALTAAVAFACAYFLQFKGWRYHGLPALGLGVTAVAAVLASRQPFASFQQKLARATLILACFVAAAPALVSGAYRNDNRPETERALEDIAPGEAVMVFSANASTFWPMIEERLLVWPSRHFTYWMLPAIAHSISDTGRDPNLDALALSIRKDAAHEIVCAQPRILFFDTHEGSYSMRGSVFDTREFFMRDADFASEFEKYRFRGSYGRLLAYQRVAMNSPTPAHGCRKIW